MRPALYEAFHFVWPADVAPEHAPQRRSLEMDMVGLETVDVVGPVCEVSDHFARDRKLPPVAPGDLLAVFAAGAYGATMASRYNSFPLPAEVLVDGDRIMLARRRETYHDLVSHELTPTLVETRDSGE
jgi:diaminopimelate decarboxylase